MYTKRHPLNDLRLTGLAILDDALLHHISVCQMIGTGNRNPGAFSILG